MEEIAGTVICFLFALAGYFYGFSDGVDAGQSDSQTHT